MTLLCPNCHRPFSKKLEKKEVIDVAHHPGELSAGTRAKGPVPLDLGKEVVNFKYYYRCKHCGHEWTETKQVDFGQPGS